MMMMRMMLITTHRQHQDDDDDDGSHDGWTLSISSCDDNQTTHVLHLMSGRNVDDDEG